MSSFLQRSSRILHFRHVWTSSEASSFVQKLSPSERKEFLRVLEASSDPSDVGAMSSSMKHRDLLRAHFFYAGIPFVGFGFLDNAVMILAGESIEWSIGASFCISTMAAAALGNTLSDVFGIGSAWYVERLSTRFSGGPPKLSYEQLHSKPFRLASTAGRTVGIVIGCLLGMFPLLFIKEGSPQNSKD